MFILAQVEEHQSDEVYFFADQNIGSGLLDIATDTGCGFKS